MSINNGNSNANLTLNTRGYKFAGMKTTLAERLNMAMAKRHNMTQAALAEASGVAQPTIWRLTKGRAKTSGRLVDIANALGVNVDWLANGVGEMESLPLRLLALKGTVRSRYGMKMGLLMILLFRQKEKQNHRGKPLFSKEIAGALRRQQALL